MLTGSRSRNVQHSSWAMVVTDVARGMSYCCMEPAGWYEWLHNTSREWRNEHRRLES